MTKLEALIARIDAVLDHGNADGLTDLLRDCREALVNGMPLGRVAPRIDDVQRIRYIPGEKLQES